MQEVARKKKRERTDKIAPPPLENHGENTGKTLQGEPTNPETRNARRQGGGKTRQGEPHQPREKQKSATRRRKKRQKRDKIAWGKRLLEQDQLDEVRAQRRARAQVVDQKQNNKNTTHKSCRQSILLILVVPKTTVVGTMHPHPGTPKQRKQGTLQGRSLKGLKIQDRSPKAPDLFKFPKHKSQTLTRYQTHQSTALRKTQRGGGAHGPPRLSGESFRGTLVPRSRSSSAPSPSQTHPPVISNDFLSVLLFVLRF